MHGVDPDVLFINEFIDIAPSKERLYRLGSVYKDSREVLHDNDAKIKSGEGILRVKNDASFSGMAINGRLYSNKRVRAGAPTWLHNYQKPVLRHHRSGMGFQDVEDPIGRVRGYKFQSLLPKTQVDSRHLEDDEDLVKKEGTGILCLESDISDPDAIEKIIDKRYKTTSVGFVTDSLICTVCKTDWKNSDPCEHIPGRMYTPKETKDAKAPSKLCLLRTGQIEYIEQSFVNVPAARRACVTSFEIINNAMEFVEQTTDSPVSSMLVDSLLIGGVKYNVVNADDKEVISVSTEQDGKWVTIDDSQENKQEEPEEKEEEEDSEDLSDYEVAFAHILKRMRDTGTLDFDLLEQEDGLTKDDVNDIINNLKDAKLSTKQRASLSGKSFCGPERSFPIPDCSHHAAGLRLLGRYKGPGDKSKIKACIIRKGKKLGCQGAGEKNSDSDESLVIPSRNLTPEHSTCDSCGDEIMPAKEEKEVQTSPEAAPVVDNDKAGVSILEAQVKSLQDQVLALTQENESLAQKVKLSLARNLLDARIRNSHPSTKDLKDDEAKSKLIEDLAKRSTASLEDAIQDESVYGTREFHVSRGSVASPVEVDKSKDDPQCHNSGNTVVATPVNYRTKVAGLFAKQGDK